MQTATVPTLPRVPVPPPDAYCPRCERRLAWAVAVARIAASRITMSGPDADAVAAEADRIAREDLAKAGGCWG